MKIGAHIEAVIEILEAFDSERRPLDKICSQYFKERRFIGSKDRRTISEFVYTFMRKKNLFECWAKKSGLNRSIRSCILVYLSHENLEDIFSGAGYAPEKLTANEKIALKKLPRNLEDNTLSKYILLNYPKWMEPQLQASFPEQFDEEMAAFGKSAPFDLRVNPLILDRSQLQKDLSLNGFETEITLLSPFGLRSEKRIPLDQTRAFKNGEVEVQDEGSQLICLLSQVKSSHQILDFCAGAGGKTMLLSALMRNKGHVTATDVHDKRLQECKKRLKRSKVQNAHCQLITDENDPSLDPYVYKMDRVLVDAPCTGSGTWRRNPDLKWRTSREDFEQIIRKQKSILAAASRYVSLGGRLIYATCSILRDENEGQVENFLSTHDDFEITSVQDVWKEELDASCPCEGDFLHLSPLKNNTDGFFAAILTRNSSI